MAESLKGTMTEIIKFFDSVKIVVSTEEFGRRQNAAIQYQQREIEQEYLRFQCIMEVLNQRTDISTQEINANQHTAVNINSIYTFATEAIHRILQQSTAEVFNNEETSRVESVPILVIPMFNGRVDAWLEWKPQFFYHIWERNFTDEVKQHALIGSVHTDVWKMIDRKETNDLDTDWEMLCEFYDNFDRTIDNVTLRFIELPPLVDLSTEGVKALMELTDKFFEFNITMGLDQDPDNIFLYGIIMSKVNQRIRIQWQDQRDPNTAHEQVTFLKFLQDLSKQQPIQPQASLTESVESALESQRSNDTLATQLVPSNESTRNSLGQMNVSQTNEQSIDQTIENNELQGNYSGNITLFQNPDSSQSSNSLMDRYFSGQTSHSPFQLVTSTEDDPPTGIEPTRQTSGDVQTTTQGTLDYESICPTEPNSLTKEPVTLNLSGTCAWADDVYNNDNQEECSSTTLSQSRSQEPSNSINLTQSLENGHKRHSKFTNELTPPYGPRQRLNSQSSDQFTQSENLDYNSLSILDYMTTLSEGQPADDNPVETFIGFTRPKRSIQIRKNERNEIVSISTAHGPLINTVQVTRHQN